MGVLPPNDDAWRNCPSVRGRNTYYLINITTCIHTHVNEGKCLEVAISQDFLKYTSMDISYTIRKVFSWEIQWFKDIYHISIDEKDVPVAWLPTLFFLTCRVANALNTFITKLPPHDLISIPFLFILTASDQIQLMKQLPWLFWLCCIILCI